MSNALAINFINKESFIYDNEFNKYFSSEYNPIVSFVFKNGKLEEKINQKLQLLIHITTLDKSETSRIITYDNLNKTIKDNDIYLSFTTPMLTLDSVSIEYVLLFDDHDVDRLTLYFSKCYNLLTCNLVSELPNYPSYMIKLEGSTNAYMNVPTSIDVLVNGVKTSPVNILNMDDKLTLFKKDIYLTDGMNDILIVATDICGNRYTYNSKINVTCIVPTYEKVDLLDNFIGDDDNEVSLHIGNADLQYVNPNVGMNKDINIDTSIDSHYFKLEGNKANLYRISKNKIPKIQSDIVAKPLAINFDYVEKIYDGTVDATPYMKSLKLNNGYYFCNTHDENNDFVNLGVVKSIRERKIIETNIFVANEVMTDTFDIYSQKVIFNNFKIVIDKIEGYALCDEENEAKSTDIIFDVPDYSLLSVSDFNLIFSNLTYNEGLFYCKLSHKDFNNNTYYTYKCMDNRNCYDINNKEIFAPLIFETTTEEEAINWLTALHHSIKSVKLIRTENDGTSIVFEFLNNEEKYKVTNSVSIKYNYIIKNSNDDVIYRNSDEDKLDISFSNAIFSSKYVTDETQLITCNDLKFINGPNGDASKNYQIANYIASGKILKRTIYPHINCLDKIYDGSPIVPFEMSNKFYNGLENSIINDEIYIDTTFEGNKDDVTHIFEKHGSTVLLTIDSNVGLNKPVTINSIFLEGRDSSNYKLGEVTSNFSTNIYARPIYVSINKIRLIRSKRIWEIDYTVNNDISTDNITISYNTNDEYDIKVFGGINTNGESIHSNYNEVPDILTLFFNYDFNPNYQYINVNESPEVKKVGDTSSYYLINDVRPAEPDTERIDITTVENSDYSGNVELKVLNDSHSPYFESEDKQYKIYNGCTVTITNVNLDINNEKTKNYYLDNHIYETTIEII